MAEPAFEAKDLWSFALGVYMQEGIAPHFLAFQEELGADVNLLLYACWEGGCRGRRLSPDEFRSAGSRVAAWHEDVVRPLRSLRKRLKLGFPAIERSRSDRLREQVKALELSAERLELDELETAAVRRPPDAAPDAWLAAQNLRALLAAYAERDLTLEQEDRVRHVAEAIARLP